MDQEHQDGDGRQAVGRPGGPDAARAFSVRQFAKSVGQARQDVSEDDLARLAAEGKIRSTKTPLMRYLVGLSRARSENRRLLAQYSYQVVSLGSNCLPRTVLTRWGVKKTRAQGEKSMPFDLALFAPGGASALLAADFQGLFSDCWFNAEKGWWVNRSPRVGFNHDADIGPGPEGLAALMERYRLRAGNFRAGMRDPRFTLFVYATIRKGEHRLEQLAAEVARLRGDLPYALLVSDTDGVAGSAPEGACYAPVARPMENYKWSALPHYSSPEGQDFESRLVRDCLDILLERSGRAESGAREASGGNDNR